MLLLASAPWLLPLLYLGLPLGVLVISFVVGQGLERAHYRSLIERERRHAHLPVLSLRTLSPEQEARVLEARLVTGSVVVSVDHFNRLLASWRMFLGGELSSYRSMLERGRREAVLRLKEACPGATLIVNARLETSAVLSKREEAKGCLEVFAYGTALFMARPEGPPSA